jgi:hypothetical protein
MVALVIKVFESPPCLHPIKNFGFGLSLIFCQILARSLRLMRFDTRHRSAPEAPFRLRPTGCFFLFATRLLFETVFFFEAVFDLFFLWPVARRALAFAFLSARAFVAGASSSSNGSGSSAAAALQGLTLLVCGKKSKRRLFL